MDLGLSGKRALVVGGSGFIGRRVVARLTEEGVALVLAARNEDRLAEVSEGRWPYVTLDTRDQTSVRAGVDRAIESLGGLDILVNTGAPSARAIATDDPNDPAVVLDALQTPQPGSDAYAPARQGRTSADEVAALTAHLCSAQASTISGTAITIGHASPGIIRY